MSTVTFTSAAPLAGARLTTPRPGERIDADQIEAALRTYCAQLRINASDTAAVIAWALRSRSHTLQAIREGRQRAAQLHWRATHPTTPTKA